MDAAKMVASVEKMIRAMAARYALASKGAVLADDLIQLGREAAFASTKTYRADGGTVFSTYAYRAMRFAMKNELRRSPREQATLDAPRFARSHDDDECFLDGLPSDVVPSNERLVMAERKAQVRKIVARVKAEHFAAKPVLYALVIARLQLGVEIQDTTLEEASTFRSEMTLEEIADVCGCSREWVRKTETKVRARLADALMEVA